MGIQELSKSSGLQSNCAAVVFIGNGLQNITVTHPYNLPSVFKGGESHLLTSLAVDKEGKTIHTLNSSI